MKTGHAALSLLHHGVELSHEEKTGIKKWNKMREGMKEKGGKIMKKGKWKKEKDRDKTQNGNEGDGTPEAKTKETRLPKHENTEWINFYFLSKCKERNFSAERGI